MQTRTHASGRRSSGTSFFTSLAGSPNSYTVSGDLRAGLGAVAASAGGALASLIGAPVPWLVGSLLVMAGLNLGGYEVGAPRGARQAGQAVIGVAVGLYFAPAVVHELGSHLALMVGAGLVAILWGAVASRLLARLGGIDRTTAFFASIPGGMSEMSILGDRFGADPAPIAMAQSIRMVVVVLLIPGAITLAGTTGTSHYEPPRVGESWAGMAVMLAAGTAAGWIFARARVSLAWLLGPMLVGILFAVTGSPLSTVPAPLGAAGQVLIACALGARFRRSFLLACRRLALAALATSLILLAVSVAFGVGVARLAHLSAPAVVLGTAPGGLPEASITAKILDLGVPLVAAFHLVRLVLIVLLAAPLFRGTQALGRALGFSVHHARYPMPGSVTLPRAAGSAGCRSCQRVASWYASPTRSTIASSNGFPTSCRPTGSPSANPHGTDSAGSPVRFQGYV